MASSTPTRSKKLVFIVEDDKFFMDLLLNHFSSRTDLEIMPFYSGQECLAKMELNPDLVILDYVLDAGNPYALNGKDVFKKIIEIDPKTKIIFLSGQDSSEIVFDLIKVGVRDYVMKEKDFIEELDELLLDYLA
jgi:DNA-binding NarL/FixJ family response regulator